MKNADSHIYLYAKGHYEKNNLVEDMKKILGKRSGIDPEYMTAADVVHVLLSMTSPYIKDNHHFREFILDLHPVNYWKLTRGEYSFDEAVIRKCLSILRMTQVIDKDNKVLIELDDPDPDILPLSINLSDVLK